MFMLKPEVQITKKPTEFQVYLQKTINVFNINCSTFMLKGIFL